MDAAGKLFINSLTRHWAQTRLSEAKASCEMTGQGKNEQFQEKAYFIIRSTFTNSNVLSFLDDQPSQKDLILKDICYVLLKTLFPRIIVSKSDKLATRHQHALVAINKIRKAFSMKRWFQL